MMSSRWWTNPSVLAAIIGAIAMVVVAMIQLTPFFLHSQNRESFPYSVRVETKQNRQIVSNAKVSIIVGSKAPLVEYTDNNGFSRFAIEKDYTGHFGTLQVEANGFEIYTRNIDILPNELPAVLQLERQAQQSLNAPTATSAPAPTATSAPAPTATSAPAPTATSAPAPTASTSTQLETVYDCSTLVMSSRPLVINDAGEVCWLKLLDGGSTSLTFNGSAQISYRTRNGGNDVFFFVAQKGDQLTDVIGATIRPERHITLKFGTFEALKQFEIQYHSPDFSGGWATCIRDANNGNIALNSLCS
jgi:hypothetical protein